MGLSLDAPSSFVFGESNKSPEYLAKFPHGKIPAFEGSDGFTLFETQAIARYSKSPNDFMPFAHYPRRYVNDEKIKISYPCLNPYVDSEIYL